MHVGRFLHFSQKVVGVTLKVNCRGGLKIQDIFSLKLNELQIKVR